jgi:peroxiredoxin
MYPHERSLVKKYESKPFAIVGVNSDDSLEKLQKVMKEKNLPWTSFFDGGGTGGPIATQWGVRGWPTVYVIDQQGIIRETNARGKRLDEAIEKLLGQP